MMDGVGEALHECVCVCVEAVNETSLFKVCLYVSSRVASRVSS